MTSAFGSARALLEPEQAPRGVTVNIGGMDLHFRPVDGVFTDELWNGCRGFLNASEHPSSEFAISLDPTAADGEPEVRLSRHGGVWRIERGSLTGEWDARSRRGWAKLHPDPHSIDSILRVVHMLILAEQGGFLLHASSIVRNGRAFVFSGFSGAGKTTICQLAPLDSILLTDEISYIRPSGSRYRAHGTPFTSSDSQIRGHNISAPIEAVYLLEKGTGNFVEAVDRSVAARSLLRNILLFARDPDLVNRVFEAAVEFASRVPVRRLTFTPNERVWELIG